MKFKLGDYVLVKPFGVTGMVIGIFSLCTASSTIISTTYKVSYNKPYWETSFYFEAREYLGSIPCYVEVCERDLEISTKEKYYKSFNLQSVAVTKTCECGKDRHGFSTHSTWCPLHV